MNKQPTTPRAAARIAAKASAAAQDANRTAQPLPADCIARVHTLDDLLLAIGKVTAMGARLGQSVRVTVVPMRADTVDQSKPAGMATTATGTTCGRSDEL